MKEIIDRFLNENREWLKEVPAHGGPIPSTLKAASWSKGSLKHLEYTSIFDSSDIASSSRDNWYGGLKSESGFRVVITATQLLWIGYSWDKSGYYNVKVEFEGKLAEIHWADVLDLIKDGRSESTFVVRFSGVQRFELPAAKLRGASGLATFLNGLVYSRLQIAADANDLEFGAKWVSQIPSDSQLAATKWPAWVQDKQGNRERSRELLEKSIATQQTILAESEKGLAFPLYQAKVLDEMVELAVTWSREAQDYWTAFNDSGSGLMGLNRTNIDRITKRHERSYRELVANLGTVEQERRRILLVSREYPVVQDQRLLTLSDQHFGSLTFSNGSPIEGEYYVMDPVNPMVYHPLEDFNTVQFKHHFHAALGIINQLVPKRVSLTNSEIRSEATLKESNEQTSHAQSRKQSASAQVSTPGVGVEGQADWGNAEKTGTEQERSDAQSVATRILAEYQGGEYVINAYPSPPAEDDFYYRTDLELQRLVKDRLSGGALKKTVRIELNKTISVTKKTLDRVEESLKKNLAISAKVAHKASKVSIGGKFKTDFQSETKSLQTAKAEIDKKLDFSSVLDIEFFSSEEIEKALKQVSESLPLERQLLDKLRRLQADNYEWRWIEKELLQFGKDHGIPIRDLKAVFKKFRTQRAEWIPQQRFISDVIRHIDARLPETLFDKAIESVRADLGLTDDLAQQLVSEARRRARERNLIGKLMKASS